VLIPESRLAGTSSRCSRRRYRTLLFPQEIPPLDDPLEVAEKLDQLLGPNTYTLEEIQSIFADLIYCGGKGND